MDIEIEKIIRTKRKTIAFQITDNSTLIIRAPFKMKDKTIIDIVNKHKKWIEKKKKNIENRDIKYNPKRYVNGEEFLYLGIFYRLKIIDNQKVPLKLENEFYLSKNVLLQASEVFIKWYKKMAYEKISERVRFHAQEKNFKYNKIKITNAQKRWGSCSIKGNLNFSWYLIMAPLDVIDYVVIHELVHLEEKNHKKAFWDKVSLLMPDYKIYRSWLKKNGYLLKI